MRIYEYDASEIDELLPFRNAIFGQISLDRWLAMNCTGVVARQDQELVGFIPLQFREQKLNARVTIPVVYENAVGVAEGKRGQGIGTAMVDEAASFISDRVDAMMVVRGGERSDGYRFYRKTGHSDLMYACGYYLEPEVEWPPAGEAGISVVDRARWLGLEPQLLDLHEQRYGRFGGGQQRGPGYWAKVLDGHVSGGHPWQMVTLMDDPGRLAGYLVVAQGAWPARDRANVFEVVGQDGQATERLLRYARRFVTDGMLNVPLVSLANPVRPLLRQMGFSEGESTSHVMARILRPDRIYQRLAEGSDLLDTLSLTVVTPHRTLEVNGPPDPRYTVRLETKEHAFARLFCCRLDLDAALDVELVRWRDPDPGLGRELGQVFAPCEWVQWFTDYV